MAGGMPTMCPLCEAAALAPDQSCPACGATANAVDLASSYQTAKACFRNWQLGLGTEQVERLCRHYDDLAAQLLERVRNFSSIALLNVRGRCWDCGRAIEPGASSCPACGATNQHAALTTLRHLQRLVHDLDEHHRAGRLPLSAAHAASAQAQQRMAALRSRLSREPRGAIARSAPSEAPLEATLVSSPSPAAAQATVPPPVAGLDLGFAPQRPAAATAAAAPPSLRAPRRSAWEILLDPRSLQWLLGLGGALLVVGLVIWLATLGVFDNAYVVAGCLAVGNGALLAGGWFLITQTRFQTAGRAVTLLACLVMPLNLWFYHAQSLLTLDGHLWVAAVVICALYAISAYVLRDSLFVYVLHGGVALAGLLMLADSGRFAEIGAPAAMLITLALISIHVERAFPEGKGPFARHDFGMAFFWSGQVLLVSGLAFLLGGQLTGGWFYALFQPMYDWLGNFGQPYIVTTQLGQMLALALVVAGMYGYLYSDLVVRRVGYYMYGVVFTLLWAEVLTVELLQLQVTLEVVIFVLAGTSLIINVMAAQLGKQAPAMMRAGPPLGFALTAIPVVLGLLLHLRTTIASINATWLTVDGLPYAVTPMYAGGMVFTALVCLYGAYVYRRQETTGALYYVGSAAATLLAAAALLSLGGIETWAGQAPLVMLIPIAYLVAARAFRGHSPEKPLVLVGQLATGVMLVSVIGAALHITPERMWEPIAGETLNLLLAVFFAEAAVFYVLAATVRPWTPNAYLAAAAFAGALWQLLVYYDVSSQWYTLVFAVIGLLMLVAYRLALFDRARLAEPAYQAANAIMSLSFVAAVLQTLSRLATGSIQRTHDWSTLVLLGSLVCLSLCAANLVRQKGWRGWYLTTAVLEGLLLFLTLHALTNLTGWQKLELFLTITGIALLGVGHVGWYREQRDERHSDNVGFCLTFGSLFAMVPITIGLLYYRADSVYAFSLAQGLHEVGVLGLAILLIAAGGMCQVRSTAFSGAAALVVFLLSLVLYIHIPDHLKTAGIMLTVAGGSLFTVALVLSMYRDSLVKLPEKIKRREGIFQVLSWR